MKKLIGLLISCGLLAGCNSGKTEPDKKIITVSIAPFSYFVHAIADDDFKVNIMVPAGTDPHVYEPFPEQINQLRKSVGYISNGFLGFEMNWLDRFYETNRSMKKLSLGSTIEPLAPEHHHHEGNVESADPHYWVSPRCAMAMAASVKSFVSDLNPLHKDDYEKNYNILISRIKEMDSNAGNLFSGIPVRCFMIYHPNLAYLAKDYGLEEIAVEFEGKEPPPSRMKELIDKARQNKIKTIFVQREYDTKNARAIADEIGARVLIIDPLSEDWMKSTTDIINALHNSLMESSK